MCITSNCGINLLHLLSHVNNGTLHCLPKTKRLNRPVLDDNNRSATFYLSVTFVAKIFVQQSFPLSFEMRAFQLLSLKNVPNKDTLIWITR